MPSLDTTPRLHYGIEPLSALLKIREGNQLFTDGFLLNRVSDCEHWFFVMLDAAAIEQAVELSAIWDYMWPLSLTWFNFNPSMDK